MAASPIGIAPSANARQRPLALTSRRLEANRRNAARSTGPRTAEGKARVARNAIKHGFFAAQARWTPEQYRDFEQTLDGLRGDFKPQGVGEESCVWTMAHSYIRMAALLRYENGAAARYHQDCERELNQRIGVADPAEAEKLEAERERLRRAGLWRPTIPGPREAMAIIRYEGKLDRAIRGALSDLQGLKSLRRAAGSNWRMEKQTQIISETRAISESELLARFGDTRPGTTTRMARWSQSEERQARHPTSSAGKRGGGAEQKTQKQTHYSASRSSVPEALRRTPHPTIETSQSGKTNPLGGIADECPEAAEGPQAATSLVAGTAKTNPLTSMFTGNRHERRRARVLAKRPADLTPKRCS